jgi:chemotaxis signal transduction protein
MKKKLSLGRLKLESDSKKLMDIVLNAASSQNVVVFRLGENPWAFSIEFLIQTLRAQKYTFFNDSSDISFVRGYIIFHREAIPVISVHKILDIEPIRNIDNRTAILLCKIGDTKFGLLTEEVLEIIPADDKTFRQIPSNFLNKYRNIITGAYSWKERIAIRLELQNILNKADLVILQEEGEKILAEQEGK